MHQTPCIIWRTLLFFEEYNVAKVTVRRLLREEKRNMCHINCKEIDTFIGEVWSSELERFICNLEYKNQIMLEFKLYRQESGLNIKNTS